jgi:hypothetical protein
LGEESAALVKTKWLFSGPAGPEEQAATGDRLSKRFAIVWTAALFLERSAL